MKLKIKFMNGSTTEIEIDNENLLVSKLKYKVCELKKESEYSSIKLIFFGRILKDEEKLSNYKIKENSTIICFIKKSVEKVNESENVNEPENTIETENIIEPLEINNIQLPEININNSTTSNHLQNILQNPEILSMLNIVIENPQMRESMMNSVLQNLNIPIESPIRSFYESMLLNIFTNPNDYINLLNSVNTNQNISSIFENNEYMQNIISSLEEMNFNISESSDDSLETESTDDILTSEDTIIELKEKYELEIEQIKNMGFDDEIKIINTLEQCYGSVSIALNKLLE